MGDGYLSEGKRKQAMDRAAQAILERQRKDGAILMAPAAQAFNKEMLLWRSA